MDVREVPEATKRPPRLPNSRDCEACGDTPWRVLMPVRFGLPLPETEIVTYRACRRCARRSLASFMARVTQHAHAQQETAHGE